MAMLPPAAPLRGGGAATPGAPLLFLIVIACWGTGWLPIRIQVSQAAPETTLFWRMLISALVMAALVRLRATPWRYGPRLQLRFAAMGLCLFGFNYLAFYYAAFGLPTGMLAVIFSTASLHGFAIDAVFFGRRISLRAIFGVLLGITGLVLVFLPQIASAELNGPVVRSFLLAIAGTALFSAGGSLSALCQRDGVSVRGSTAWAAGYGTLLMTTVLLLRGGTFAIPMKADFLLALGWHVVVSTVIAFIAYLALVGEVGIGKAAYTTVVFPVIALILSTLFEGLDWTPLTIAGVVLVGLGNVLVLRRRKPTQAA